MSINFENTCFDIPICIIDLMLKISRIKINKIYLNLFLNKIWEKSQNFSITAFIVFEIFRKNQLRG